MAVSGRGVPVLRSIIQEKEECQNLRCAVPSSSSRIPLAGRTVLGNPMLRFFY